MPKAISMTISIPGAELWINYLEGNKRISSVEWTLPNGVVARCRIWDTNIDPVNPIYDQTRGGPESGSQNVPGSYRMVEVTEEGETFYDLPPNLLYIVNMETIG